jgi:DNA-3-methyladenine glycosylase
VGARRSLSIPPASRLDRSFFTRPPVAVARELLGCRFVRITADGVRLSGRIVETEAYDESDPASHSFRGPTARNASMFGLSGLLYVYRSHGIHACCNVVTGSVGEGSAVLLRAVEPLEGLARMTQNRGGRAASELCSGPGRLSQALEITVADDGRDLTADGALWVQAGADVDPASVAATPRIGLSKGVDTRWRFVIAGDPWPSRTSGRPRTERSSPR